MSKLADLIHGASKSREAAEMNEIVSGGEAPRRGAFGRQCQLAHESRASQELSLARQELIDRPYTVEDGPMIASFRKRHSAVRSDVLDDLISRAFAVLHPPANHDDGPEQEAGEIARRSR
jgi:hypothetical protein